MFRIVIRVSVSPLVDGYDSVVRCHEGGRVCPNVRRVAEPVDEDERDALGTPLDHMDLVTVGAFYVNDLGSMPACYTIWIPARKGGGGNRGPLRQGSVSAGSIHGRLETHARSKHRSIERKPRIGSAPCRNSWSEVD